MTSIFTPLLRYRAEGNTRREDFLADVLCGVSDKRRNLAVELATWLMKMNINLNEDYITITTQRRVEGGQPEIWIEARDYSGNRHVLIVENKLETQEEYQQLQRYYETFKLEEATKTRTLAYVTHASTDRLGDNEVVHLRWFEVHRWLKDWTKENEGDELVSKLMKLLEDWNMDNTLGTTDLAVATLWKTSTRGRLIQILDFIMMLICGIVNRVDGSEWTIGGQWSTLGGEFLYFESPVLWVGKLEGMQLEYGFDFKRNDDEWNVGVLQVPSAFIAIRDNGNDLVNPEGWTRAPQEPEWNGCSWVKQKSGPVCLNRDWTWADFYRQFFEEQLGNFEKWLVEINAESKLE